MAGSYNHIVTNDGKLRPPENLCSMLECMSGDVYEACHEMYGMIWWLADRLQGHIADSGYNPLGGSYKPPTTAGLIEQAQQSYLTGIEISPGVMQ